MSTLLCLLHFDASLDVRARHGGGALSAIGSAVQVHENAFKWNSARANSTDQATPFFGYGGAVHVQSGTTVECKDSLFSLNEADVGGAVFVEDGSFMGELLEFSKNAVFEGGVGGAVAVEVSKGQNIPYIAYRSFRKIIFQCDGCEFKRNNGSLAGGY